MALHFGFYHSDVNDPRTYSAEDMSRLLDGIITDGVFESFGNSFNVIVPGNYTEGTEENSFRIAVGPGKAWYNGTWTMIDEDDTLFLDIEEGAIDNDRVDEIVIEVNKNTRINRILVLKGLPGAGVKDPFTGIPALPYAPNSSYKQQKDSKNDPVYAEPEEGIYWYPLYYITIPRGFGNSAASYIPDKLEITRMAYDVVSSPVVKEEISELYTSWQNSWTEWFTNAKEIIEKWLEDNNIEEMLSEL